MGPRDRRGWSVGGSHGRRVILFVWLNAREVWLWRTLGFLHRVLTDRRRKEQRKDTAGRLDYIRKVGTGQGAGMAAPPSPASSAQIPSGSTTSAGSSGGATASSKRKRRLNDLTSEEVTPILRRA